MEVGFWFLGRMIKTSTKYGMKNKIFYDNSFYMSKPCDALKFSTRSEQEEYWALKPFKMQLPAKEIITKKYEPDTTPQVKLIVNNDERKNNLNFIPPKNRNRDLQGYAHTFNQFDYLGHYCAQKVSQIVYLKFNNNRYNQMADGKHRTRVMSSFYVPFQQLYSESQHLFTKSLGFKWPENHEDAVLPNSKNNKGCALDPIFCSEFETGNLFAAIRKSPYDYELILQNDVNSCLEVGWFNFSVEFQAEGYYSFCIKNMTKDMKKLFDKGMKICYCFLNNLKETIANDLADDWNFCGENLRYTQNDIQIEGEPGQYYFDLYFEYKCKNKGEIVQFALEKPYISLEAEKFFAETAPKKLKGLTKIQKIEYGKTIAGTPLNAYLIRKRRAHAAGTDSALSVPQNQTPQQMRSKKSINLNPATNNLIPVDSGRRSVVIIGRLSGSDVSSSSILQGMVDFLLETIDYDFLKRSVNFYFIPMSNVDSVKYGNSLTNLTGSNLNDSWRHPHVIYQAETYFLKTFMSQINNENPITHVFSLNQENQEIYSSVVGTKNQNDQNEDSRIFPFVLSKKLAMLSFQHCFFHQKDSSDSMTSILTEMFPKVLAYEIKVSKFEPQKEPEEGAEIIKYDKIALKQCKRQSYYKFGQKFMEDFLEHVKIYDKNSLLKNKWLRQIEQIQEKLVKFSPKVLTQRSVLQRFNEKFIHIKNLKLPKTPAKTDSRLLKKFDPNHFSRIKQERQKGNLSPKVRRHQNMLVRYLFDDLTIGNKGKSIEDTIRKTLGKEKSMDKPQQFRIRERTNQVIKSTNTNLKNFELGIISQERMKKDNSSPYASEKENLQKNLSKDISLKKLKRVRNDQLTRMQHQKDRFGDFLKP